MLQEAIASGVNHIDTVETNVLGVIAVTQAMLPLLREAPAARIVNVSSSAGSLTLNSNPTNPHRSMFGTYSWSKTALNAITVAFASDLESDGIKVNAACPGLDFDGPQQFPGYAHGPTGRTRAGAPCAARRERSDGHVFERGRPAPVVTPAPAVGIFDLRAKGPQEIMSPMMCDQPPRINIAVRIVISDVRNKSALESWTRP